MPNKIIIMMRILIMFTILIIAIIIGYETLLMNSRDMTYVYVTNQEIVSERIAKDALLLQNGTRDQQIQAINELQSMLSSFEKNQQLIASSNQPDTVTILLLSSRTDFVAVDTAVNEIVKGSKNQQIQVQIILDHERPLFLAYAQISSLIISYAQDKVIAIFIIIISLKILLISVNAFLFYLLEKSHRMNNQKHEGELS